MSIEQYIAIAVTILVLMVFPLAVGWELWRTRHQKASDRPAHTSVATAFLGALDRIVRPSVEHQIEEENRVVKDEKDVGGN